MRAKLISGSIVVVVVAAAGCGDDGGVVPDAAVSTACRDRGGDACFQLPTAPIQTREGAPARVGCGPIVPALAATAVTFTGDVASYGSNNPIAGSEIRLYTTPDFTGAIAMATSVTDSTYSITVPAGTPDLMWGTVSGAGYLTAYRHVFRPDLSMGTIDNFNLRLFKPDNVEGAAILVKEDWDPSAIAVAGTVVDCDRNVVQHAAVTVSSASGRREFVDGLSIYYSAPGVVPLAVPPDERGDTNDNGTFAAFRVRPGAPLFAQAWGFPDAAAQASGEQGLVLFAEHELHVVLDSVIQISVWANR